MTQFFLDLYTLFKWFHSMNDVWLLNLMQILDLSYVSLITTFLVNRYGNTNFIFNKSNRLALKRCSQAARRIARNNISNFKLYT